MENNIEHIKAISATDYYIGEDGLKYCPICNEPLEVILHSKYRSDVKVPCICLCTEKRIAEDKARARQRYIEHRRADCFRGSELINARFNTSESGEAMSMARNYATNFASFSKQGVGLLLHGRVGSGKSHIASCIANEVIDKGYTARMTNISQIVNELQLSFDKKVDCLTKLNEYSLLVIDDLGIERNTEYMAEQLYTIINARYTSGKPMVITTNLTASDMSNPPNISSARVYDRILERCHPLEVKGMSRRRAKMKTDFEEMERILKGGMK